MNMRIQEAYKILSKEFASVLDLGCRDQELKKYLHHTIKYQGIDFEFSDGVIGHNLEEGIPFDDSSFDVVFALDVLEHLENIHFLIEEIKRVAKKEIIIAIPNLYYYRFRFKYLFGKELSGKYTLFLHKTLDRHRWITSFNNAKILMEHSFQHHEINIYFGTTSKIWLLNKIDKLLQKKFPNLFAHVIYFHIRKSN